MFRINKKNLLVSIAIFSIAFFGANNVQAILPVDVADPDGFGTGLGGGGTGTNTNGGEVDCPGNSFQELVACINGSIINPLLGVLVGIALVAFLWGVVKYIAQGDKPEEKKKGLVVIGWGILGLFIMVSVWGFVNLLTDTFFGGNMPSQPPIPQISL